MKAHFLLALLLNLSARAASEQLVEVYITPDGYQVGELRSTYATPIVDEVVRIKPAGVLLLVCPSAPPDKVLQMETELRARHEVERRMVISEKICPSKV